MTTKRISRSNCEQAFANYIISKKTGTDFEAVPVNVRAGELDAQGQFKVANLEELPLPFIAVACPNAETHPAEYSVCALHVVIGGSIDGESANTDHANLVGWAAALFGEENLEDVVAALNPPASGPDPRVMKDFLAFGIELGGDASMETDRAYIDDFTMHVHCQPTTDVSR